MGKDSYIYEYFQDIQNGTVTVGRWIELIYRYIVDGLEQNRFFFDAEKANNVIDWIEHHCFHTEGPDAPNPLKLELWEKAFLSCLYGIVDEHGQRQFREVLLVIGRKNGKSKIASSIGAYEFRRGGYGSRVFCIAPKLEQADLGFRRR